MKHKNILIPGILFFVTFEINSLGQNFQHSVDGLISKIQDIDLQLHLNPNDSTLKLMKFSNQFILMIICYGAR